MINKLKLSLTALSICFSTTAFADVIHAGLLIDGKSDQVRKEVSIVIEDNKIVEVVNGYVSRQGHNNINLKDSTVMPGLMDMHVHLTDQMAPGSYIKRFQQNAADYAYRAAFYAEKTLMSGFTTVRNPGDEYNVTISLRNAINKGFAVGPRVYSAGNSVATTGGHADPTNGFRADLMGNPGPKSGVINGPDDAWQAIRQHYKDGADFIKLTVTGGVLSLAKSGDNPQFNDAELEAIVAAANDYNFHVAVHAHGVEGMKRAIKAGVHSVEHGTYMDKETMRLMIENGTYYVPTILAGKFVAEKAAVDGYFPEVVRPKAAAIGPKIQHTFSKAYKAGVKIAFGTDSGVSAHGDNAKEFVYMVEAGMPAMEAIQSATIESAKLLRVDDELGSIEQGKLADIVAVKGDVLKDVSILQHIDFVMKDGVIYKQ